MPEIGRIFHAKMRDSKMLPTISNNKVKRFQIRVRSGQKADCTLDEN